MRSTEGHYGTCADSLCPARSPSRSPVTAGSARLMGAQTRALPAPLLVPFTLKTKSEAGSPWCRVGDLLTKHHCPGFESMSSGFAKSVCELAVYTGQGPTLPISCQHFLKAVYRALLDTSLRPAFPQQSIRLPLRAGFTMLNQLKTL